VTTGPSTDEIIAECWTKYQAAKASVQANVPPNYMLSSSLNQGPKMPQVPLRSAVRNPEAV